MFTDGRKSSLMAKRHLAPNPRAVYRNNFLILGCPVKKEQGELFKIYKVLAWSKHNFLQYQAKLHSKSC